jgi:hypothetical protein
VDMAKLQTEEWFNNRLDSEHWYEKVEDVEERDQSPGWRCRRRRKKSNERLQLLERVAR